MVQVKKFNSVMMHSSIEMEKRIITDKDSTIHRCIIDKKIFVSGARLS